MPLSIDPKTYFQWPPPLISLTIPESRFKKKIGGNFEWMINKVKNSQKLEIIRIYEFVQTNWSLNIFGAAS